MNVFILVYEEEQCVNCAHEAKSFEIELLKILRVGKQTLTYELY